MSLLRVGLPQKRGSVRKVRHVSPECPALTRPFSMVDGMATRRPPNDGASDSEFVVTLAIMSFLLKTGSGRQLRCLGKFAGSCAGVEPSDFRSKNVLASANIYGRQHIPFAITPNGGGRQSGLVEEFVEGHHWFGIGWIHIGTMLVRARNLRPDYAPYVRSVTDNKETT
jgi:hypothetical protein